MTKNPSDRSQAALTALVAEGALALRAHLGVAIPRVCVGFSGGLDSSVLVHLLLPLHRDGAVRLSAIHVNHGLSPNADQWAGHCDAACRAMGIPLQSVSVAITRKPRQSLEEEARRARHAAFETVDADVIALAHHADDQAETVLLQLLRGAGPRGLSAMATLTRGVVGREDAPRSWRPLLGVNRRDILACASEARLSWIEDESNQDIALRRNFVRHRVLATLAQGFPSYAVTLGRVAALQAQCAALLGDLADTDLSAATREAGLDCAVLQGLGPERLANALRRWLELAGARPPSARRLEALVRAVLQSSNDTRLRWDHESLCVRRVRGTLEIVARA